MVEIGFAGGMGAGKTTVADILVKEHRYHRLSFADPIRYMCTTLLGRAIDKKHDRTTMQRIGGAGRAQDWAGIDTPLESSRRARVETLARHIFPDVTDEKIAEWASDPYWGSAGVALRMEQCIALDVDHYGAKKGADQLAALEAELGLLPATITNTSRGQDSPSRQHFYRVPDGIEFITKAADDIDVLQFKHRYAVVSPSRHPESGEPYAWYDVDGEPLESIPFLDDLEELPQAWIDHLRMEAPVHRVEQAVARKTTSASPDEERQIADIIQSLESLPAIWQEGAGWHNTVFRCACWLARMAKTNEYAMTRSEAENILLLHTPTYPDWGQDRVVEQWQSAVATTEGQLADPIESNLPTPIEFEKLIPLLPSFTSGGDNFLDLITQPPAVENEKETWKRRRLILREAMQQGMTDEQAASLAWASRAGGLLRIDPAGLPKLWREVREVRSKVEWQQTMTTEDAVVTTLPTAEPVERPAVVDKPEQIDLLNDAERQEVLDAQWFGSEYMEWVRESLATVNEPYHRMALWMILSLVYSSAAYVLLPGGRHLAPNIWGITIGKSTTGKSESMELERTVLDAYFHGEDHPDIGGDATPEALIETLILRDGKASWFNSDEAHGHIEQSRPGNSGYLKNLREKLTDIYGGRVPMIQRQGKRDLSGVNATAFLTMQYAGIDEKVYEVLQPSDWDSGFLHRFVWAIGADVKRTRAMKRKRFVQPGEGVERVDGREMQRHWAIEFENTVASLTMTGHPTHMRMSDWVIDRDLEVQETFEQLVAGHRYETMLKPSIERFTWTIIKCAMLVAASQGKESIDRLDYLIALEQAEEWLANVLYSVSRTNETGFRREVNRLEKYIAGRPGRRAKPADVYKFANDDKAMVDRYIQQLLGEERVKELRNSTTGERWYEAA